MLVLPSLRWAQLQSFTESLLSIVDPLTEVAPQTQKIKEAFTVFQQGMMKDQASSGKEALDRSRDQYIKGLLYGIQSEQHFPQEVDHEALMKQLLELADNYGFGLIRLPYNDQSSQTDNLLTELEAIDLSSMPHISRWITKIREANNSFKKSVGEYLSEQVETSETLSATKASPELIAAIEDLFVMLFSYLQIAKTDALEQAYKEIVALTNSYKN
ncbi:MAG: DUF6261 family protein [Bacteroidota bacterium]